MDKTNLSMIFFSPTVQVLACFVLIFPLLKWFFLLESIFLNDLYIPV